MAPNGGLHYSSSATTDARLTMGAVTEASAIRENANIYLDDVAFWDVELSGSDMADLASGSVPAINLSGTHLRACYNFENGTGTTITDRSTGSNNATMYNSPVWTGSVPYVGAHIPTDVPSETLADGMRKTYVLESGNGKGTINWPATVKWPSGTEPVLNTGSVGAVDVVECVSNGTNLYCKLDMEDCK